MNNKNYLTSMHTINGINVNDFGPGYLEKKQARRDIESKVQKEQKEIIRRLRIQNKKLIEQVIKLKEEAKKTRLNKNHVLNHINELLKLING